MEVLGTLISEAAPRGGRSGRLGALLCSGCPQDPPPPGPVLTLPPYPAPQAGVWRSWRRPRM